MLPHPSQLCIFSCHLVTVRVSFILQNSNSIDWFKCHCVNVLIAHWQHLLPDLFSLYKMLGSFTQRERVWECGGCLCTWQENILREQLCLIHGLSSANGLENCFLSNTCLITQFWLDNFHFYCSCGLPSWQRMEEPNNTQRRLIKTSLFEVCLCYQINLQLYMQ